MGKPSLCGAGGECRWSAGLVRRLLKTKITWSSPFQRGDLTKVVALSKVRRCLKVRTEYWLCELGKGRE